MIRPWQRGALVSVKRLIGAALALGVTLLFSLQPIALAFAVKVEFSETDIRSVFHIAKSEDSSQVHYGIHLDENCLPKGEQPVFVYWRELEKGLDVTSHLLAIEQPAYGIRQQRVEVRMRAGGRIMLRLEVLPDRAIAIESFRDSRGNCIARGVIEIERRLAILQSVYVKRSMLYSVEKAELTGSDLQDGHLLRETIRP
jgi:hypothetical protein